MSDIDVLIRRIESVFSHTSPPRHGDISSPTYDDEGTSSYFSGKTWRGHTAKQLRALDFSPAVFTDEAFAYYLPAYMVADLLDPVEADTISEALLYWLSPADGERGERAQRIVARLAQAQREAVVNYFEHVRARDGECQEGEFDGALRLLRTVQHA